MNLVRAAFVFILVLMAIGAFASNSTAVVIYDESVDGDLPAPIWSLDPVTPTLDLGVGLNQVQGVSVRTTFTNDRDAFEFQLPQGARIESLVIDFTWSTTGGADGVGSDHKLYPNASSTSGAVSFALGMSGASGTGSRQLFDGFLPEFGGSRSELWILGLPLSSVPGEEGTMTYSYTVNLSVVPEPTTGALLGAGSLAWLVRCFPRSRATSRSGPRG